MNSIPLHYANKMMFFDKNTWSKNSFSWFYAIMILILVTVFAVILKYAQIYESMPLRVVNVFFILIGFVVLIKDYENTRNISLKFTEAFTLCIRTGFYFALLFLPMLLFFLLDDKSELTIISSKEILKTHYPIQEMVISNYIETAATVAIMSYVAAISAGFRKSTK